MKTDTDILVIDDEEVILGAIKKIVSMENLSADTFLNVTDALDNIDRFVASKQDQMDKTGKKLGKNGFELLNILKQKKIATPVVITTGFSTLENAVRALYEGAVGFIPKPFTIDELLSIVMRGLEYGKIFGDKFNFNLTSNDNLIEYVPCPPKYFRLGNDSWMNRADEGLVTIGITDLFLKSIGMIRDIEFMNLEDEVYQGGICLKITDNKEFIHQLLSPLSGKILEINNKIVEQNSLLEKDPYFDGWIYRMVPSNLQEELENIISCSSDI